MQLVCDTKFRLSCPTVDPSTGIIYALCRQSGAVLAIEPESGNNCTRIGDANGQPAALVVSPFPAPAALLSAANYESGGNGPNDAFATSFLLADPNRQGIIALERSGDALVTGGGADGGGAGGVRNGLDATADVITSFEGKPFFGPSALTIDAQGEIVFVDGGLPGDSSLTHRIGAVYRTVNKRTQLTRLVKPSLACPSAVATVGDHCEVIYIAEMAENRVLRMTRLPDSSGYYYTSVFTRMSGSMGPTAIAVHPKSRNVYVAMYDLDSITANNGEGATTDGPSASSAGGADEGLNDGGRSPQLGVGSVHVYDALGELQGTIAVRGSQITGICFSADFKSLFIAVDGGAGGTSYLYTTPVSD